MENQIEIFIHDFLVEHSEKDSVQANNVGIHYFFIQFLRSVDLVVSLRYFKIVSHESDEIFEKYYI